MLALVASACSDPRYELGDLEVPTTRQLTPTSSIVVTTTEPAPPPVTHLVQTGEVLGEIASRYGVSVEDLMETNGISDPGALVVGTALVVPVTAPEDPDAETTEPLPSG